MESAPDLAPPILHVFGSPTNDFWADLSLTYASGAYEALSSFHSFLNVMILPEGTWRVVYAPHMDAMSRLVRGRFYPVEYILRKDGTMTSHAKYNLPLIGSGWLSVSGTYGSEDGNVVCRVDFDKAWVSLVDNNSVDDTVIGNDSPFPTFESVPDSLSKSIIQVIGQLGFVKSVSVFPVSYLDDDTIVFDFELLGTRICARKVGPAE